jgi:hypothetical protein
MSKEIKNRITLDASRFERGASAVSRASKNMQRSLSQGMGKALKLGAKGMVALGAAGIAAGTAIAVGVKKVVSAGADLQHLSQQTGAAVSQLMVLRQVFKDAGVSSDKVGTTINRLQKSLVDAQSGTGDAARAFADLNLPLDELRKLKPDQQFRRIGAAIAQLDDPAQRAAVAMAIFGRSGAELQGVFAGASFDDAAGSIGTQAKLMEKNAAIFERTSTLLDRTGSKLQGFFVGIADKVVPVILPLLEKLDKLDLAEQGQRFGQGIANGLKVLIGLFQSNLIGAAISESLLLAGQLLINTIARGLAAIAVGFGKAFVEYFKQAFAINLKFWPALALSFGQAMIAATKSLINIMRDGFFGIATGFAGLIAVGLGKVISKIPGQGARGRSMIESGQALQRESNQRGDKVRDEVRALISGVGDAFAPVGKIITTDAMAAYGAVADAFLDGFASLEGFDLIDTTESKARLAEIISNALAAGELPPVSIPESSRVAAFEPPELTGLEGLGTAAAQPLTGGVSSLASIGGGGGVGGTGIESAIEAGNKLLSQIDRGIRGLSNKLGGLSSAPGGVSNEPVLI